MQERGPPAGTCFPAMASIEPRIDYPALINAVSMAGYETVWLFVRLFVCAKAYQSHLNMRDHTSHIFLEHGPGLFSNEKAENQLSP